MHHAFQKSYALAFPGPTTPYGRVKLVASANLEAWQRPEKDEYLLADVAAYEDEDAEQGNATVEALTMPSFDDEWWMGASACGDVAQAIYSLVDAVLESASADA